MHRQTLQAKYDEHVQKMAIKRQEDLVKQAKEEYAKIRAAKSAPSTPNGMLFQSICTCSSRRFQGIMLTGIAAIVTNPEDPNFDLEKLLKYWEEKL
mgnify:FL=1